MSDDRQFQRRGGLQAYLVAAFSLGFTVALLLKSATLASALLAAGGLSVTVAAVALASRFSGASALWLATVGVGSGLLTAAHGAYDAIAFWQQIPVPDLTPTDPRGLVTFGVAGLWMLTAGLEMRGRTDFPARLSLLAIVGGADLIVLFLATLLRSTELIMATGGLAAVVLGPAFWVWTGRILRT